MLHWKKVIQALTRFSWWEAKFCKRSANKVADMLGKLDHPSPILFPSSHPGHEQYLQDMQAALTYNQKIAFAQCCAAASSTTISADFINQMSALQVSKAGPSTGGLNHMKEWLYS
eukprot:TRINITY_DN26617_c2_g1_i1.p1 TRINITY_DN26617_c2_g1~~TRINITY_DN26617_c2_g1_i1.p1  ORF type:complete len:115 (-),score=21.99 TRINITY_DN26617_c2_g1_i1:1374-1718(-)